VTILLGQIGLMQAAELLRAGGLVAFPTETVYGLGARADLDRAVARIFEIKGRPARNPTIVHVADIDAARTCATAWPSAAETLAMRFWPGPLTIVLPAAAHLSRIALAGGDTVGLRVPGHRLALELLQSADVPVAAPSANRSGHISPTRADHVMEDLGGLLDPVRDAILDGGQCAGGIESTVVSLCGERPLLLRPGLVSRGELEEALGHPIDVTERREVGDDLGPAPAPGGLARHYAPNVPTRLVNPQEAQQAGDRVVVVALPGDPMQAAADLYDVLRRAERRAQIVGGEVWIIKPPDGPEWAALWDRLRRAAS